MKITCTACNLDCSNAYVTYNGYPYHYFCVPMKARVTDLVKVEVDDDDYATASRS